MCAVYQTNLLFVNYPEDLLVNEIRFYTTVDEAISTFLKAL